jgi:gliding motility-associated transport system ATP-binding protein
MLEVRDLHKHYGSFRAVRGLSFTVDAGEVVGFLGPNGAGKTTTMKIAVGYMGLTSGRVEVDGLDVSRESRAVRERIGYLPEHAPLYDDMTVAEYLRFMATMRGLGGRQRRERLEHVIGVCSLQPKRRALVSTLSKGYRQRVGLAQAIVHDPKLVVLDEPTVGLDPNQIVEIREVLREIGERNTVILSSHILSEVEATCRRVIIIAAGQIVARGTPDELQREHGEGGRYRLRLDRTTPEFESALPTLPGVWGLDRIGAGQFRFGTRDGEESLTALRALAAQHELTVSELAHEPATLEDVFRRLTASEEVLALEESR